MRKCVGRLNTNGRWTSRYTDGTGRTLDSTNVPTNIHQELLSNRAYPPRTAHWQPMVLEGDTPEAMVRHETPHKGLVVVSGAGVVGCLAACMFSLRGWFVTIVERKSCPNEMNPSAFHVPPVHGVEYALLTRRALDAFEMAGVPLVTLKQFGQKVKGVIEHPSYHNTWLTKNLNERYPFPINMLSIDLVAVRRHLDDHVRHLPSNSCKIFYDHQISSVMPTQNTLFIKPLRDFSAPRAPKVDFPENNTETSLTMRLSTMVDSDEASTASAGGIKYDLLIGAEGSSSRLRDLVDVEGFATDRTFGVMWYTMTTKELDVENIHRWVWKAPKGSAQLPIIVAFPMAKPAAPGITTKAGTENDGLAEKPSGYFVPSDDVEEIPRFAVMAYFPIATLNSLSAADMHRMYFPDVKDAVVVASSRYASMAPTIHCEKPVNTSGLPNCVMLGDAMHHCNPFCLQNLAIGVEDAGMLLNHLDGISKNFYDALNQFGRERGTAGDAMRLITERSLYYHRKKHSNPVTRFRNHLSILGHRFLPYNWNKTFVAPFDVMSSKSMNTMFPKSINDMLNGRGYTSYDRANIQQTRQQRWWKPQRLYT